MLRDLAIAVAVALILAGCGALPSPGSPTSTDRAATETSRSAPGTTDGTVSPESAPSDGTATATATRSATLTPTSTPVPERPAATFILDDGSRITVTLEVADAPSERGRGLMHRRSLERNHGMLFVYGSAQRLSFWMKNVLIPLDIIFIDANHTVLNVAHADVEPNATASELARYRSDGPAKYVIEVNRGFANRTGVGPGTGVEFHGNRTLLTPEG